MKKVLGLLSVMMLSGSISLGASLTINTATSLQKTCDETLNRTYYLGKTSTRYFSDILGGELSKHYLIGFGTSYGTIYDPYAIFQFQNGTPTFGYKSEIKPRDVQEVIVAYQNEGEGTNIVNHGAKRSDIAGQIVFSISRYIESKGTQSRPPLKYMNTNETKGVVSTNVKFDSPKIQDNECLNVYVGRCGDGIIDDGKAIDASGFAIPFDGASTAPRQLAGGETCDDGPLNGTPGHCNIFCSGNGTGSNGSITLHKSLVTNKTYYSGDLVQWRIDFTNQGATDAINVVLQDELPMSLTYVDSTIFGVTAQKRTVYGMEGEFVVEYTGFNLKPGASGYILLSAKVK